jgi:hypothetical protein
MSVRNKYTSEMKSMIKMMRNKMHLSKRDTTTDVLIQKTSIFAGVKPRGKKISNIPSL